MGCTHYLPSIAGPETAARLMLSGEVRKTFSDGHAFFDFDLKLPFFFKALQIFSFVSIWVSMVLICFESVLITVFFKFHFCILFRPL
jgi:hypothetical protein